MFEKNFRFIDEKTRNLTVIHKESNVKITSPDFTFQQKSDDELKKEVWEVMKTAMKIWNIKNENRI